MKLAGYAIKADQGLITFGSGNQIGSVTIGKIAGGDIIELHIHLPPPSPPDPLFVRVLTELDHAYSAHS